VLLGMIGMIYLLNRSPYPGFDDGLGFLLDAETGFNLHTNATNHVLYNNLQHVLARVFFFLPTTLVLTMLPIICSVLTLNRIYQIGNVFTGPLVTSLMPVIILGLSFTFWQQSEIIEVYAFNNLLFVNFLYFAIKDLQRNRHDNYIWVSLFLGLGLLTHIQNILSIPFFLYYLLWQNNLRIGQKLAGLGIFAGLFFLLFIPPLLGNMNTAAAVFFDRHFQDSVTAFSFADLLTGIGKGTMYLIYNFHLFLIFILHGWYLMWRDRRNLFGLMALLLVPYLGFAVKYNVNDNHVFFLIPYILIVLPSVFSFVSLAFKLIGHMSWMLPLLIMMSPMMYGAAAMLGTNIGFVAKYDVEKAYKGGAVHLLWPGKAWAKDPLALAKQLYHENPEAFDRGEVEWNYPAAIQLLRMRGEL
jgi:hypothetical protein